MFYCRTRYAWYRSLLTLKLFYEQSAVIHRPSASLLHVVIIALHAVFSFSHLRCMCVVAATARIAEYQVQSLQQQYSFFSKIKTEPFLVSVL